MDSDDSDHIHLTCGVCQETILGTSKLSQHLLNKHDPLSAYPCGHPGCRKRFLNKQSLIRHISSYHKDGKVVNRGSRTNTNEAEGCDGTSGHGELLQGIVSWNSNDEDGPEEASAGGNPGSSRLSIQQSVDKSAVQLLVNLRSTASLTGKAIERFEDGCSQMLVNYVSAVKEKLAASLVEKGVSESTVADAMKDLVIEDPFKNLKTIDDQLDYFSKEYNIAKPSSNFLDTRIDKRLNPVTNSYVPTQVTESFQYVSIIQTLKSILTKESARKKIFRDHRSKDGIIRSYADGSHCKNHPFISKHENVVQILLFYDELEVANSLGSKTIIHKLGAFFYQMLNLPPEESSELSSIHLLALTNADDMKKPGAFKKVLAPFVQEMKKLSSDDGVKLETNGEVFVIRAVLVALTADTPAAHDVLGFLGVGARHFCRKCMISRAEVRENANAVGEMRTEEQHCEHLEKVARCSRYATQCGVKMDSPLNEVPYFHSVNNSVFDCFHDLCEGVIPLVLRSVLHEYVNRRKLLTVSELNSRIASFAYGYPDAKNKPSPNFTVEMLSSHKGKLKQTGSQMWCLMRSFPFLIGDLIPLEDDHMEIIFLLQDIMDVIFSFEIRNEDLHRLDTLIFKHNELFEKLFVNVLVEQVEGEEGADDPDEETDDPDELFVEEEVQEGENREEGAAAASSSDEEVGEEQRRPQRRPRPTPPPLKVHVTNKLHHLKHYVEMIREFGNPVRYWCAKFEGRLKIFRQHAAICCNFKNTPKTMAKMFQLSNMKSIIDDNATQEVEHLRGERVQISLQCENYRLMLESGIKEGDQVLYTNGATVRSEEYRPGLFVHLQTTRRGPVFGLITKVIVCNKAVYLVVRQWKTEGISQRYNAYKVIPDQRNLCVVTRVNALSSFRCIAPWTTNDDDIYLSPRTVLM